MSYKLKLGVALAVAALALPTLATAQDPSSRLDITVIGAVLPNASEQVVDTNAVATPELPVVYEDETAATEAASRTANADASATDASANLGHSVESE